ncbi:unnamed protein product, partial [marine sediment metagenome]
HKLTFPVGNPYAYPVDITLEMNPFQAGWNFELDPVSLTGVGPDEIRLVDLYVTPPQGVPLPVDGAPVVDVEAKVGDVLVGGFRKVFRPPVPLHVSPDPPYAEREISVFPYPVMVGEPTEICVELRNPTSHPQDVVAHFAWANFGIGLPFAPIGGPRLVHLPPNSIVNECLHWVPPVSGHVCLEVTLEMAGYAPQKSQRNLDVDEPLEPGVEHQLTFPVGNPFDHLVDISLGIVPHQAGWGIRLEPDILAGVKPGEIRAVTLSVTPPAGIP